jgi:hypothetical protein
MTGEALAILKPIICYQWEINQNGYRDTLAADVCVCVCVCGGGHTEEEHVSCRNSFTPAATVAAKQGALFSSRSYVYNCWQAACSAVA